MISLSTWLSAHRRSVLLVCSLFICFIYLDILPTPKSSPQLGNDSGYYDNNGEQGFDFLPDDLDYHLQPLQMRLSAQKQPQPEQQSGSIFSKDMFAATNSHYDENDPLKPLTVVLLRKSSRSGDIERLVQQILNYPFFKEIIIYNTDPHKPMNKDEFMIPDDSSVNFQVINVSKNDRLNSLSRYTLCASMASYEHCYFQDDDIYQDSILSHNTYWDTLYINFLRYPSLIHANVQPSRFMDHYRWRFHNQQIKMHSGYIDLAFGAIVPRWKVQHFLTQLGKSGLGKDRLYEADAYFSIWSNQYPWLLDNPLATNTSSLMDPSPHIGDTRRMIYDAARRLHRTLQSDLTPNPKDYVDRIQEMPPMHQRDTRSSCANDRCLFITNIEPVAPEQLGMAPSFDKAKYTNPKDWDQALDDRLDLPQSDDWVIHGYHNAVDQRNDTCWTIKSHPRTNDYFGLIALGKAPPSQFVITTTTVPAEPIDQLFKISVLRNQNDWYPCKIVQHYTSRNPINDNTNYDRTAIITDINFTLDCSSNIPTSYKSSVLVNNQADGRYLLDKIHTIKATFLKDLEGPFEVCGLTVI